MVFGRLGEGDEKVGGVNPLGYSLLKDYSLFLYYRFGIQLLDVSRLIWKKEK